jgi:hypothetical protein
MADPTAAADTLAYAALLAAEQLLAAPGADPLAALLCRFLAVALPGVALTHPECARLCARVVGRHTGPAST